MSSPSWREAEREKEEDREPEITLSTASLLALFLGLVSVCGVFFGFGYSVGRRAPINLALHADSSDGGGASAEPAAQPIALASPAAVEGIEGSSSSSGSSPDSTGFGNSGLSSTASGSPSSAILSGASSAAGNVTPLPVLHETLPPTSSNAGSASPSTSPDMAADHAAQPAVARSAPLPSRAQPALAAYSPLPGKASAIQQAGHPMVQVAAVVHREDADVLVSALRKLGYRAVVRTAPQDKFLHVQVGPFASRVEANAMRKKLFSDGYNAIIKQ